MKFHWKFVLSAWVYLSWRVLAISAIGATILGFPVATVLTGDLRSYLGAAVLRYEQVLLIFLALVLLWHLVTLFLVVSQRANRVLTAWAISWRYSLVFLLVLSLLRLPEPLFSLLTITESETLWVLTILFVNVLEWIVSGLVALVLALVWSASSDLTLVTLFGKAKNGGSTSEKLSDTVSA